MYLYAGIFIAGAVFAMALWRYIIMALYWVGMAFGVLFAWRIISLLDNGAFTLTYAKPIFIGALSALVVCILCSGYIRHTVILFYLRSAIQRDKDNAQRGKLW